jgi:sugar/nucleoside kinase (ribokinase family)
VLAALGDVVDDIVVRLDGAIRRGTDTAARVTRRRGGSAANVAATAAALTGRARLLAQIGDDSTGDQLLAELAAGGVDVSAVRRNGTTASIVVVVDADGERSFLTDTGSARLLDRPDEVWLDGVGVLHVPTYSLVDEPIATTATTVVGWALARSIPVSIDASSVAVIEAFGVARMRARIEALQPSIVFANEAEAAALGIDGPLAGAITVVKYGAAPAIVNVAGRAPIGVAAEQLESVADTTGAGDAFAAGFLTHPTWLHDPEAACRAGHAAAATLLSARRYEPLP